MKIIELISSIPIIMSNEEHNWYKSCSDQIYLDSLSEREQVIASSLIKKGLFDLGTDKKYLIKTK